MSAGGAGRGGNDVGNNSVGGNGIGASSVAANSVKADRGVADRGAHEPLSILVCALGGEGGGVLTEWLVETAQRAGYAAQSTSIPGVAQRTGATTYYVEIHPVPIASLGGRRPVLSLYPVPGRLDLLASSELLETARQAANGLASPGRTMIVTSSARALTTNERMQMGDGRVSVEALLDVVRAASRTHWVLDMSAMTREAGTVVSAVMFGAIAATGLLPFTRAQCEETIRAGGKSATASLAGFALAFDRGERMRTQQSYVNSLVAGGVMQPSTSAAAQASVASIPSAISTRFPPELHRILALGHARLVEYQDERYASLYLARMSRILDAEQAATSATAATAGGHPVAAETARYLALWMAFDDIVRVAELKARASREARVRREVRAEEDALLRVYDHFKPGVPEIAAMLPARWAAALLRRDARRRAAGHDPWSMPIRLGTHTVAGMLALRVLGGLKGLRRHGSRFVAEQALIERWLAAVEQGTRLDRTLGHEIALCGRLIKGYGSTNERGRDNLLHIVDHLATQEVAAPERALRIRAARTAALADENGTALDRSLAESGAPTRPVKAVPIRFVRKTGRQPA